MDFKGYKLARKSNYKKIKNHLTENARVIAAAVILILLVLIIIFSKNMVNYAPKQPDAVAVVNGEIITEDEFNRLYSRVPEIYKMTGLTEEVFLQDTLVPHRLLLQEAKKQGIMVSEAEIQGMVDGVLEMSGGTEEEFEEQLKLQNMTLEEFKSLTKEQLLVTKLLNQTVIAIDISDDEIKEFYDENQEYFATGNDTFQELSEVEDGIRQYLANQKYMEDLTQNADIQILLGETDSTDSIPPVTSSVAASAASGNSFTETSDETCAEDGKPIIILFSTTTCPHCRWIKSTFDSVAESYGDTIAAYHWELDTNDDTLTSAKESAVPDSHLKMFWERSPKGGVPTYVFGCRYYRIGNAYELNNDLDAEAQDFKAVIDSLLK